MVVRLRQHQSQSRPILWCWLSPALRSGLLVSGTWKLSSPAPPKPFRTYPDLVALLASRGVQIHDPSRAERKLAQLGYYRLSGYWYPVREFKMNGLQQDVCSVTGKPLRLDTFQDATSFDTIVDLYKFDKRLRMLMLDAVERLEVNLKTVMAHEVGYHDPMAYTNVKFILHKWTQPYTDRRGNTRNMIDTKPSMPGCTFKAMGFPDETGFPRKLFGI